MGSTDWIRDLVYLAFPEGDARERVLLDLIQQFAKMDPQDPEWLRYKLTVVECRAMENIAAGLVASAAAQDRLRGVTREISDFAARELKVTVQNAAAETRQLLEDVQANLHDAIAGEAILKSYTEETRERFGIVIARIMEAQLGRALEISQAKMELWVTSKLNDSIKQAEGALAAVTRDFRVKLFGAWSSLLWGVFAAGLLAGVGLLAGGFWLGRHW
ncbi:hypothetical protein [Occallatibacter riparius]|uniref:Uncharacterized protein n=1 Tax=Occallatibacter riparius TaxID=1002689 RepID=A0A9J7BW55_9BACT|nr:hypothetical protein [Occallatibacter riparius]UWZ85118.1 hypothetical protein MOP44_04040 [Occallatibacter riparius]